MSVKSELKRILMLISTYLLTPIILLIIFYRIYELDILNLIKILLIIMSVSIQIVIFTNMNCYLTGHKYHIFYGEYSCIKCNIKIGDE